MNHICVVGTGYVGLVTGACFAELGYRVTCVDIDEGKVASLRAGHLPIYEPDLEELVLRNMQAHRLYATSSLEEGLDGAQFLFMCVGTPTTADNQTDLRALNLAYFRASAVLLGTPSWGNSQTANHTPSRTHPIIVNKSTIPPGTSERMELILARMANGTGSPSVVANPEFLREGQAIHDFMHPSRVVVGARDLAAAEAVAGLYKPLRCPILITNTRAAEMIKYASNAFLATKISFINEIASLCGELGVDVEAVATGMGLDPRIGKEFLRAGIGYGGSCLPKDMAVLAHLASACGQEPRLLNAVMEVNSRQPRRLVLRVKEMLGGTLAGARVAVLGLSFKPHTDDTRCSPAIEVIKALQSEGAWVRASDPAAYNGLGLEDLVECLSDPYQAAQGCDAAIIATDWPQFKALDLPRLKTVMRGRVLADGRNVLDPGQARQAGFIYLGVGRGSKLQAGAGQPINVPAISE